MSENEFPDAIELFRKHFPDARFGLSIYQRASDGHDHDNFIGGIPKGTPYLTISLHRGSWQSDTWEQLQEAYEREGYETHLRKSNGKTRTRSGTCHHAKTQLYIW